MRETVRIIIADDTDITREGLTRILASEPDLEIVDEGATLHEAVRKVLELRPDILILDLRWFDDESAGIDAIGRLSEEAPETKVIAITIYPHLIEPARAAGAAAALNKEIPKQRLIEEIRSVHALPPTRPPQTTASSPAPEEELTPRELQVLRRLAQGKTDQEIGKALNISKHTAKNHVSNILGKFNVHNRAGAVAAGYRFGLIEEHQD